jgi:choline kinase
MRTTARSLVGKFHDVVDRMIATLHQQRAIEARRVLQRYRHLLETQPETLPLNEVEFVCSEEEFSENAHQPDARERGASHPSLARA